MRALDAVTIIKEEGPRWLVWRLWYEVQLKWGFSRSLPMPADISQLLAAELRLPPEELDSWLYRAWLKQRGAFFVQAGAGEALLPFIADRDAVGQSANRILAGDFPFFTNGVRRLRYPPDWFQGVQEGMQWRSDVHWSRVPDLSPELGDIKYVWEPSRFGFAFQLARAWVVTGDERYPEAFWTLTENWLDANRPELGPHWRCGQEMSLRTMAWVFGLHVFSDCPSTTPQRVARVVKHLWYHAVHVEKVHWYAANCIRNNHAISEAVGLFTVGTLFPFLPDAKRWRESGMAWLAKELAWQVYDDGAYVQHSMNYARLVVQLCTWALRLADVNGVSLPEAIRDAARRLLRFMVALQDPTTGRVSNYGSNDGALILPLSSCNYLNYRPALGALSLALGEGRLYERGPWDEEAAWLCGPDSLKRDVQEASVTAEANASTAFPLGGYYTFWGKDTHAIVRCATYRHRPAQADMLHLDIWYNGHNVLVDPGTYSYNVQPPWAGYFVGTASHNTVTVDGRDQMRKGSRFLWLNWTKSRLRLFGESAGRVVFDGEHSAYAPIIHRRTVLLEKDTYLVFDELTGGRGQHSYRLHWLLNDFPIELLQDGAIIRVPGRQDESLRLAIILLGGEAVDWARAQEEGRPRGWQSLYYGVKSPAWSLELTRTGDRASFVTILGPRSRVDSLVELGQDSLVKVIRRGASI